jgi:NhaA family Na+:H+ antiporter
MSASHPEAPQTRQTPADFDVGLVRLPDEPVDRLLRPIVAFLHIEAVSGLALLAATGAALFLANSPFAQLYFDLWDTNAAIQIGGFTLAHDLRHVINDGLMTLFFFLVGLEIKRELVLGELRDPRVASLPLAAAVGGMVVPALFYLVLQAGSPGERGWGIVMATDIAFVVGALALLGKRVAHSLRVFVLSLAIIDDIGAVLVIALAYSAEINGAALGIGACLIAGILGLRRLGVRSVTIFFAIGILAWLAFDRSGIHPTILGVVLGLFTPARPRIAPQKLRAMMTFMTSSILGSAREARSAAQPEQSEVLRNMAVAARETLSPLERLETALHPWVSFLVLPLFAFANAGIPLTAEGFASPLIPAIALGLVVGKPLGILGASWLAVRFGLAARVADLSWSSLAAAGVLCGIGFTMALFIASLAFEEELLAAASLGVLIASVVSALFGLVLLRLVCPKAQGQSV